MKRSNAVRAIISATTLGMALALVVALGTVKSVADASPIEQLQYHVQHSVFGNIGTYTNVIEHVDDTTTVQTTAHFLVKMLGIGLHREDAERTERWQGGRLISFFGITKKNGEATELKGEARGDEFVIDSPLGVFAAPAAVQPANPWSDRCIKSTTMMRVDNGKIEKVRVTGGAMTDVPIDGATILARQYVIDGAERYKIWFDQHNIPVMFTIDDDSGKITFTLNRKGVLANTP